MRDWRGSSHQRITNDEARPVCEPGILELETMGREDFTIIEKAPTRAFSMIESAAFTFNILGSLRQCSGST